MPSRADVILEARQWVGTPYVHQHQALGVGVDCANLVVAVGVSLGLMDWTPENFAAFAGYGRAPNPRHMEKALAAYLDRCDDPQIGDIAWIEWERGLPMHLAIMGHLDGRKTLIHAYSHVGRVVEHGLTAEWSGRIVGWWRYRGLE